MVDSSVEPHFCTPLHTCCGCLHAVYWLVLAVAALPADIPTCLSHKLTPGLLLGTEPLNMVPSAILLFLLCLVATLKNLDDNLGKKGKRKHGEYGRHRQRLYLRGWDCFQSACHACTAVVRERD